MFCFVFFVHESVIKVTKHRAAKVSSWKKKALFIHSIVRGVCAYDILQKKKDAYHGKCVCVGEIIFSFQINPTNIRRKFRNLK